MRTTNNSYKLKCKELDKYRWLLLRERYGIFGAFLRYLKDYLIDLLFGFLVIFRFSDKTLESKCDFLLLQSAPKVIGFGRKKLLIDKLRGSGRTLYETALESPKDILKGKKLVRLGQSVPLRYLLYAAYSEWLICNFGPKIVLNDRNGSLYSPFLRISLNRRAKILVHLAHATTLESSQRLSMNDYDYYVMFGRSSLESLKKRKILFGTSSVILAGSHMIDESYILPNVDSESKTILVLGVGPDKEKEEKYIEVYKIISAWAGMNKDYKVIFKPHPRSEAVFWKNVQDSLDNVHVFSKDVSLAEALKDAKCVINIMSNAVIEAALAKRAIIFAGPDSAKDIFSHENIIGARVKSSKELSDKIKYIERDFSSALERSKEFADFHLVNGVLGLEFTVNFLNKLVDDEWDGSLEMLSSRIS